MKVFDVIYETMDNGYKWEKSGSTATHELYFIDLPNGEEIAVNVTILKHDSRPEVSFTSTDFDPSDIHKMTGTFAKQGITPVKVFSTLVEILKQSPLIKNNGGFTMKAKLSEPSRVSLYKRILSKFGFQFNTLEHGDDKVFDVLFEKTKVRLDKSCWDGYHIGTPKTKVITRNGKSTRVNNCVKEGKYRYSSKTGNMEYDNYDTDERHGIYVNGKLIQTFSTKDEADNALARDRRFANGVVKKIISEETYHGDDFYRNYGWIELSDTLTEAEYRGRKVQLNKPMRGDVKKFKVFVKDPKTGNVKKVNFGDPDMRIRKSNPDARRSFRARHKCDQKKDKTTAGYWSCKKW